MAEQRNTRQRRAVKGVLDQLDGFHSAQEIHEFLRDSGEQIGLSTVYRNLVSLADANEAVNHKVFWEKSTIYGQEVLKKFVY